MQVEVCNMKAFNTEILDNFLGEGFQNDKLIEQSEVVSLPSVDVQSKEWYFDGIRIGYSDWQFKKDVSLKWDFSMKAELVTLLVTMNGTLLCGSDASDDHFAIRNSQHNLMYASPETQGYGILQHQNERMGIFMIQFTKESFLRLAQDANDVLKRFTENIIAGNTSMLTFDNLTLDLNMRSVIHSILQCKYTQDLRRMFLLSKSIELLVIQAEAYSHAQAATDKYIKSDYDKACILYAHDYLMKNLRTPPSLSYLARVAGINEYKLKKGFKETFGNTVFGYLTDARLELAKNDLLDSGKTASEIYEDLGYSSIQHFSSAFKKKFGVSPTKARA